LKVWTEQNISLLEKEIKILKKLKHPNIAKSAGAYLMDKLIWPNG
jgi:hypothetical protein